MSTGTHRVWKHIVAVIFLISLLSVGSAHKMTGKGPGFAFSGAGGRLAQHAALMEVLVKGLYPGGKPIRPSFLSGASSGSISALVLNAILETEETGRGGITWDHYHEMLFNLTNANIYDTSVEGIAEIFVWNIPHGYVLDNKNLRATVMPYLESMNYKTLSDLYIPTAFSIVNQSSGLTHRIWSDDPQYANLDIMDVVMASTALPIAFPPQQIPGLGNTYWIDGGTGIDTIPSYALLNRPEVTELYIICYGSALTSGGSHLPPVIDDIFILGNALATINDMRVDLFAGAVDDAQDSATKSYTYIPDLDIQFSTLDFDQEKLEFDLVFEWATANNPYPLN